MVQTKLVHWHIVHLYFISMMATFMFDLHKEATKKAFTLKVLEPEYTELEWNTRRFSPQYSPFFELFLIYLQLLCLFYWSLRALKHLFIPDIEIK